MEISKYDQILNRFKSQIDQSFEIMDFLSEWRDSGFNIFFYIKFDFKDYETKFHIRINKDEKISLHADPSFLEFRNGKRKLDYYSILNNEVISYYIEINFTHNSSPWGMEGILKDIEGRFGSFRKKAANTIEFKFDYTH
jgi:hypothetical protein